MTDQKDKEFAIPQPRPKKVSSDGFAVPPPRSKKVTNDEFSAPSPRTKKQSSVDRDSAEKETDATKDTFIAKSNTITDENNANNTENNNNNNNNDKNQPPPPPPLKYNKPDWAGVACFDYSLEIIKGGVSIDRIRGPRKDFVTIGRLPLCDILMEHPSLSRYHAVIQFNQEGDAFLYDLESGYGTQVNKKSIAARNYVPLKSGDQIRFGESTRLCIFDIEKPQDSVDDDDENDDALQSEEEILLKHRTRAADVEHSVEDDDDQGVSWGFQEDAVEEDDEDEDERGQSTKSDAHLLSIESEKMAIAEAKRRRKDLETMFGDDDSDEELYDKTNTKKRKAMKKEQKAETHDDLAKKQLEAEIKINELREKIENKKFEDDESKKKAKDEGDDLDSYMENLSKTTTNSSASMFALQKELKGLEKVFRYVK
ncbi:hypothetical protein BJ944DRAFT_230182 [Cunninghamella echinulata]|nr:hypothetical protein BJ944DRAFT_230182 [Cunninghamella echinulata]